MGGALIQASGKTKAASEAALRKLIEKAAELGLIDVRVRLAPEKDERGLYVSAAWVHS